MQGVLVGAETEGVPGNLEEPLESGVNVYRLCLPDHSNLRTSNVRIKAVLLKD